jgi:restriction system protein
MAQPRTLFSILLEQPWWISALAGGALFGIAQLAFPPVAPFVALPFLLLAAYVGFRQMRTVSPGQVDDRLAALRDMHWDQFSVLIADAYRKQGYTVEAADKSAYDFTLTQGSRVTLLQCRRWKVNQLGVGPLEELARAVSAAEAHNGICIAAGNVSPKAKEFVIEKPLALVTGIELAGLVGKLNKTHA